MEKMKASHKVILGLTISIVFAFFALAFTSSYKKLNSPDIQDYKLSDIQTAPDKIDYSLDRYNLIRRAYWLSGDYESGEGLYQLDNSTKTPVPVNNPPTGTVILLSNTGEKIAEYKIFGKVTSLNARLSPISEYQAGDLEYNSWLVNLNGTYGEETDGIFFFTTDNQYIEYSGNYLYTLDR